MLTPLDDFPVHQTGRPVAHPASGDPNHYDRYFFCGYTRDAGLYFAVALGLYPNREVIDGSFSIAIGRQQVSVHASDRCPPDRRTEVGPLRVEVLEPLRRLRVVVDATDQGLRADLTFTARTRAVEEPHFDWRVGTKVVFDYTRLTQWGAWAGHVELDGESMPVDPSAVLGCRDRSWGIRPVGQQVPGPSAFPPQFFWLWAPVSFEDLCVHVDVMDDARGDRRHECGLLVPVGDDEEEVMRAVAHRITWKPGTRRAAAAELDLVRRSGEVLTMRLEPVLEFQMKGIGYTNPSWGHGHWHGAGRVGGERWSIPVDDPLDLANLHVQTLCRARLGDRLGAGILEQLVIGPYEPAGLEGLNDGAPS